ncbi:uncharacterized protein LOC124903972 isoform X2 [Homo sapiens]|uniref:uncharacterized protein LOC124903972 isoform X2 n=1 Tax=Homo sapiens TaxID=9606 RepID=UPI0005D00BDA|nr:uncharacterized protein LOC124903972 isoform X2 [Homo sapiens]XP_047302713.1 uncharacterized protein LOC124903972 isoform X2 [Homo sapiens]
MGPDVGGGGGGAGAQRSAAGAAGCLVGLPRRPLLLEPRRREKGKLTGRAGRSGGGGERRGRVGRPEGLGGRGPAGGSEWREKAQPNCWGPTQDRLQPPPCFFPLQERGHVSVPARSLTTLARTYLSFAVEKRESCLKPTSRCYREDTENENENKIWYYSTKVQLAELIDCLDKDYWEAELCKILEEMHEEIRHMDITEDLTDKAQGSNKSFLVTANA